MAHGPARSVALLAALLVLLARGLTLTPADLRAAGGVGLLVYAVLTLGQALVRRALSLPSDP